MTGEIGRRQLLGGLAGTAAVTSLGGVARAAQPSGSGDPDLGPNVLVFDPAMPAGAMQAQLNRIFREQERAHFTDRRYAVLLKPGRYKLDVNVGFFTQVAGLGLLPGYVTIDGHVHAEADWNRGKALVNFWRGVENMAVRPADRQDRWAVSQAAPYRRMHLAGDLLLDDGGYSSGGFMADCRIDGAVRSGSQQQWFTRNTAMRGWEGGNWNMMFMGVDGAPASTFPTPAYTTLPTVPLVREKPFLLVDAAGAWQVFVPALRRNARGTSWGAGLPSGGLIPLSRFFIAREGMTSAAEINAALRRGLHLLLTPGVYRLTEPLHISRADTVILGLGLATLLAEGGTKALTVADVPGVTIAGLFIDAGAVS